MLSILLRPKNLKAFSLLNLECCKCARKISLRKWSAGGTAHLRILEGTLSSIFAGLRNPFIDRFVFNALTLN